MPATIAQINKFSVMLNHYGGDSRVYAGKIVCKTNITLRYRIDENTVLPITTHPLLEVDFIEKGENVPFLKFTTREFLDNGDDNPDYIPITHLDQTEPPLTLIDTLFEFIHQDRAL